MTTRRYYAAEWTYGGRPSTTIRRAGREHVVPACRYVRFDSRAERDAWVDAGPSYVGERGYRESVSTNSGYLRQAIRWAEQDLAADGYTDAISQLADEETRRAVGVEIEAISRAEW